MGLFLRQDENRTELQTKVATELEERLRAKAVKTDDTDPVMLENQHQTRHAGMIIIILIALIVITIVAFAIRIS